MKKYRIIFPLLLSCILWYSCTDWLDYKPSDKQSEEQSQAHQDLVGRGLLGAQGISQE